ncbi:MAG TPA: Holliday junction resolvase RuvX [Candidatus Omnitrophota bacterium]|nr:Holliday junction resolvase RuvX [Candidatus Omnitrophota bacterium]HPS20157.1 Holliday junction resolvase RuvX [Candidatus Omnitrophota bacterium]
MRLMGLDIGEKNIGVAISDESGMLAQGRGCVKRVTDASAVKEIKDLAISNDVGKIVVGYPLNMDGSVGVRAKDSEKMVEYLKADIDVDVILWDERLTTREAEGIMVAADISRKKRKKVIDKMAAQLILQSYLDSTNEQNGSDR